MRSTDTAHTSVLPDVQPTAVCSLSSIRAEPGRGYWFGIGSTGVAALLTLVSAQVQTDRCRNLQVTAGLGWFLQQGGGGLAVSVDLKLNKLSHQ